MKCSTSLMLIFLIQIAILPLILCRVHPIPIFPNDAKLIDETCSKTPVKDLCEAYVRSDKRSLGAKDARDLAFIMLAMVQVKATNTENKIHELQQIPGQPQDVLASCLENCNVILKEDAPQCSGAIQDQDFLTAEDRFRDMYHEINLCNEAFGGSANPLAGLNQAVHDSATVGAEIAATLV